MRIQTCSVLVVIVLASATTNGGVITDPSFFGEDARLVNFDEFPNNSNLTEQIEGVVFSSEDQDHVGFPDVTDPADTGNRFNGPFKVLSTVAGGGVPVSGSRYAAGVIHIDLDVSDMRIDFDTPQSAVGFWLIDNDFSDGRIRAFDSSGTLLETVVVPQQSEAGFVFRGISLSDPSISYLIIDGADGGALDSTFLDDLYFVPEPATLGMLLLGGLALLRRRRKSI